MVILKSEEFPRPVPLLAAYDYIFENSRDHWDKVALVDELSGDQLTFRQYVEQIEQLASGLWELGVRPGSVVGLFSPNCVQYCIVFFATIRIGATVTTANPIYTANELKHQLVDSGAEWVFTTGKLISTVEKACAGNTRFKEVLILDGNHESYRTFTNLLKRRGVPAPEPTVTPREDLAVIMYSSGTTGRAKGVMITHYNLVAGVDALDPKRSQPALLKEQALGYLPLYHSYGLMYNLCCSARYGTSLILLPGFDPHIFCSAIQKYGVKQINAAPPTIVFLAKSPLARDYNLSSLDTIFSGGAPIGQGIETDINRIYGARILQGYGMTETAACATISPQNGKGGAVGKLILNAELKIVDHQTGRELGPGESGEVWLRGPYVMKGYLNNPEATANTLTRYGWIKTGDLGYFDEDGYVYVTDRLKELIKVKGFQVAPAELEDLLLKHTDIADAAVIGVPHERTGELPKAFVVKKGGSYVSELAIIKYVEGKVAPYKELKGGVEFITEIPKSPSGKILRRHLRDLNRTSKL